MSAVKGVDCNSKLFSKFQELWLNVTKLDSSIIHNSSLKIIIRGNFLSQENREKFIFSKLF